MWVSGPYQEIKSRADIVRLVALEEVLRRTGSFWHRYDKAKWHTPRGELSISGEKFFNWTAGVGGGGAIDLVIHLMDYDFKSAVSWLSWNFSNIGTSNHQDVMGVMGVMGRREGGSKTLKLPPEEERRLPQVIQYLTLQRCLPEAVVRYLVRRGVLYADDKSNAVFLMLGKKRRVVGAEIRGTNDRLRKWHAMAAGSKKHLGCFYIRAREANTVVLCESAIDAISYFVLHQNCMAVSTSGANPNPHWINHFMDRGFEIFCAFDSDETGERTANRMSELYPAVKRLRPEKHDWNEVLKSKTC